MGTRICLVAVAALLCALPVGVVWADELSDAYEKVLDDPASSAANLNYAKIAEQKGEVRLALAAYERVLMNDPANAEARRGMQRVLRLLQPSNTQIYTSLGVGWESNPASAEHDTRGEVIAFANAYLRDERTLGLQPWRSNALAALYYVNNQSEFNYAYIGATTGPLFDTSSTLVIHPALGGGVAGYGHHYYYSEGIASLSFEGEFADALQTLRLRGAYREYNSDAFNVDGGAYADVTAKLSLPGGINNQGVLIVSPWFRWSDIEGATPISPTIDLQPGRYLEWGADVGYYQGVFTNVVIGVDVIAFQRNYDDNTPSGERHEDTYVAPGASLAFKNLLAYQTDVRFNYRYRTNSSNQPGFDYDDNVFTLSVDSRF